MMKRSVIAALLMAAVTMMTVGCKKEEHIVPIEQKVKVSRIYTTNTTFMEQYNENTQTWDTLYYLREFGITLLITLSEKKKVIIRNFVSLQLKTKILKRNEPYDYRRQNY